MNLQRGGHVAPSACIISSTAKLIVTKKQVFGDYCETSQARFACGPVFIINSNVSFVRTYWRHVDYPYVFSRFSLALPCNVKVKCTLVQVLRLCTGRTAHRGSRGIALLFHDQRQQKGLWGSASRPGRSLPLEKIRYPLYRKLGGSQGRSGQARKISSPTGIRSTDRPARSQSLYRLSYRTHWVIIYSYKNNTE